MSKTLPGSEAQHHQLVFYKYYTINTLNLPDDQEELSAELTASKQTIIPKETLLGPQHMQKSPFEVEEPNDFKAQASGEHQSECHHPGTL